ncbi:phosphotransferase family protein [Nocardia sp. NPDC052566]|uniref:phosphotransferase family protein n=1 Tax=Nocardia sp. NPDC052566 TaxID=3364330 RepID=UPI0037C70A8E
MAEKPTAPPDPLLIADALAEAGEPTTAVPWLDPLPGGASRDSWLVTAGARRYVLKRDPLHERNPATSRAREFAAARAAQAAGMPVPRPVCFEHAGGRFGTAGLISAFVDGTSSPRRILSLDPASAARKDLVREIGRAAGTLARAEIPEQGQPSADPAAAVLTEIRGGVDFLAADRPVVAAGLRWLELNRPLSVSPVLVHGDFRLGNIMVGETGLTGVIDWEFTSVGCPGQDLGFFCLRPWRFDNDDQRAGGLGSLDELLDGYAETAPEPLAAATARYWEIVGQLRWGLYCLLQEWTYRQGGHRNLERYAVGRRIAEVEWDLIDLLEEAA